MYTTKPSFLSDGIGNLGLNPKDNAEFYFQSRRHTLDNLNIPLKEVIDQTSIGLILTQSKEYYDAMKLEQKELYEHIKEHKTMNENRIRIFNKVIQKERNRLIEANHFIRECQHKRERAEIQISEQLNVCKELQNSINECRRSHKELEKFRENLKNTIELYDPYEEVLKDVINKHHYFPTFPVCFRNINALLTAQSQINRLKHQKLEDIIDMFSKVVNFTKKAKIKVLHLNTQLMQMERLYIASTTRCHYWENCLTKIKDIQYKKRINKICCFNVLERLCNMLKLRAFPSTPQVQIIHVYQMCEYIYEEFNVLSAVIQKCEE